MGGKQSKLEKNKTRTAIKDILTFLEAEVEKWDNTVKNLREGLEKGDDDWIPGYLSSQIDETEVRWENVKAPYIQFSAEQRKAQGSCQTTGKSADRRRETQKTDDEIRQLEKNTGKLLERAEAAEAENFGLKQKLKSYEQSSQKNGNKRTDTKSDGEKSNCPGSPDTVTASSMQNNLSIENKSGSDKDNTIKRLEKNLEEEKNAFERKMSEMEQRLKTEKEESEKQRKDAEEKFKIEQLKMREKGDVLMAEKRSLETQVKKLDKEKDDLLLRLKTEKEESEKQRKDADETFKIEKLKMREHGDVLMAEKQSLETQVQELDKEKNALLLRLSKIAGDKLAANNPAITDLSDSNRPTKLGEVYSELYDNEWTDAFEALKDAGHTEESAIETLRLTLENVVQFCEDKAKLVIDKSSDAVNLLLEEYQTTTTEQKMPSHVTMSRKQARDIGPLLREKSKVDYWRLQQKWKPISTTSGKEVKKTSEKVQTAEKVKLDVEGKLQIFRKEVATSMVPIVQTAYMEACWTNDCIPELKPYILKCLNLGWMMVVQSPQMVLHKCSSEQEIKFDKNFHKEYTSTGPVVSFVVWPALLLHENGPVVCKGVAEGKKKPIKKDVE